MKSLALHWQIVLGMVLGTLFGLLFNFFGFELPWVLNTADFVGDLFGYIARFGQPVGNKNIQESKLYVEK